MFTKHMGTKRVIVAVMVGAFLFVTNASVLAVDDSPTLTTTTIEEWAKENAATIKALIEEYSAEENLSIPNNDEQALNVSAPLWFTLWVLFLTACATWAAIQAAWAWLEANAAAAGGTGGTPELPQRPHYNE